MLRLLFWNTVTTPLQDFTCGMVQFSQGTHASWPLNLAAFLLHSMMIYSVLFFLTILNNRSSPALLWSKTKTSFVTFGKCLNRLLAVPGIRRLAICHHKTFTLKLVTIILFGGHLSSKYSREVRVLGLWISTE